MGAGRRLSGFAISASTNGQSPMIRIAALRFNSGLCSAHASAGEVSHVANVNEPSNLALYASVRRPSATKMELVKHTSDVAKASPKMDRSSYLSQAKAGDFIPIACSHERLRHLQPVFAVRSHLLLPATLAAT